MLKFSNDIILEKFNTKIYGTYWHFGIYMTKNWNPSNQDLVITHSFFCIYNFFYWTWSWFTLKTNRSLRTEFEVSIKRDHNDKGGSYQKKIKILTRIRSREELTRRKKDTRNNVIGWICLLKYGEWSKKYIYPSRSNQFSSVNQCTTHKWCLFWDVQSFWITLYTYHTRQSNICSNINKKKFYT